MKLKNIKLIMYAMLLFGVASCIEEPKDEISGKGTNRVRFNAETFSLVTFKSDVVETKQLVNIYRDAITTGDMNKSMTVEFSINVDSLDSYNDAHGTEFVLLDPDAYTLSIEPGLLTFAPGESVKTIEITFNPLVLDLSQKHVLPFLIKDATNGFEVNQRLALAIVQTLPINKYDGVYEVTGDAWTDPVNGAITSAYPFTWQLHTTGENSVAAFDPDVFGDYIMPILNGGASSGWGSFTPEITFDNATGDIVSIVNFYGQPAGNTRSVVYDPAVGINKWNESDGSVDMTYKMKQTNQAALAPEFIRGNYNEHLEFKGPR
jgi:hypothetical protein